MIYCVTIMKVVLFFQATTRKSWLQKLSGVHRFAQEHDWFVQVVERFAMMELEGEITDAELNGKTLTKWEAADYLDKTSSNKNDIYLYWTEIQQNQ